MIGVTSVGEGGLIAYWRQHERLAGWLAVVNSDGVE